MVSTRVTSDGQFEALYSRGQRPVSLSPEGNFVSVIAPIHERVRNLGFIATAVFSERLCLVITPL